MVWQELESSKALQPLLYSTSRVLMKYEDLILQRTGNALHKRKLPENTDIFRYIGEILIATQYDRHVY